MRPTVAGRHARLRGRQLEVTGIAERPNDAPPVIGQHTHDQRQRAARDHERDKGRNNLKHRTVSG
jgi:hypothetical protein